MLLLDDANSYWWLVRVLKTEDVGYIPAENIETPYERLARLNKHRNIDVAAPTAVDSATQEVKKDGKLKALMGWGKKGQAPPEADGEELEEREGRRVYFARPTYVDHPGVTWSDDEDEDDEEEGEEGAEPAQEEDERRRATILEDVDHILDMEADMEDHNFANYEEPDDGVEWAQDAVQALRSAEGTADAPAAQPEAGSGPSGGLIAAGVGAGLGAAATAAVVSSTHSVEPGAAHLTPATSKDLAAIAGVTPPLESSHDGQFPPPERSPSPAAPAGLAARTNPTPPPSKAQRPSITTEASPEPDARHTINPTTNPTNMTSASSQAATTLPTNPPANPATPPSTRQRKTASGQSVSSIRSSGSNYAPSPKSPTPASPAAPGAPRSFARPQPQWYSDAFDIRSFTGLVRARALEIKRNTPVPRPRPSFVDDVQAVFYGTRLDFDCLQPEVRAPYVHVQAKMDAFDREIDSLLGSLVGVK